MGSTFVPRTSSHDLFIGRLRSSSAVSKQLSCASATLFDTQAKNQRISGTVHVHVSIPHTSFIKHQSHEQEHLFEEEIYDDPNHTLINHNCWLKRAITVDSDGFERNRWTLKYIEHNGISENHSYIVYEQSFGKDAIEKAVEISMEKNKREVPKIWQTRINQDLRPIIRYTVWRRIFMVKSIKVQYDAYGYQTQKNWKVSATLETKQQEGETEDEMTKRITEVIKLLDAKPCPSRVCLTLKLMPDVYSKLVEKKILLDEDYFKNEETLSNEEMKKKPQFPELWDESQWDNWIEDHPDIDLLLIDEDTKK